MNYHYRWTYLPTGNTGEDSQEFDTRKEFEEQLAKWNTSLPKEWKYEEIKERKLRTVRMVRTQQVELNVYVFAETDEEAEKIALTKPEYYNYNAGRIIDVKYKAKSTGRSY